MDTDNYERDYRLLRNICGFASEFELQLIADRIRERYFDDLPFVRVAIGDQKDFDSRGWPAHYDYERGIIVLSPAAATSVGTGDILLHELFHAACDAKGRAYPELNDGHHWWFFWEVCRVEERFGVTTTLRYIFDRYGETTFLYEYVKLTRRQADVREFIRASAAAVVQVAEGVPLGVVEEEDGLYSEPFGEFNLLVESHRSEQAGLKL